MRFRREMAVSDRPALVFLVLFTVVCTISGLFYPDFMPFTTLLLPMFIGSLWLGPRSLPWFIVFVCACVVRAAARPADGEHCGPSPGPGSPSRSRC